MNPITHLLTSWVAANAARLPGGPACWWAWRVLRRRFVQADGRG